TSDEAVTDDERVDGVALGLVARGDDCALVWDRDVGARETERPQRTDGRDHVLDVEGREVPVEPGCREGCVLHGGRERVSDRMAQQRYVASHSRSSPGTRCTPFRSR